MMKPFNNKDWGKIQKKLLGLVEELTFEEDNAFVAMENYNRIAYFLHVLQIKNGEEFVMALAEYIQTEKNKILHVTKTSAYDDAKTMKDIDKTAARHPETGIFIGKRYRDSRDDSILTVRLDRDQAKHQHPNVLIGDRESFGTQFSDMCDIDWHMGSTVDYMAGWASSVGELAIGKKKYHGQGKPIEGTHFEGFVLQRDGSKEVLYHCYPAKHGDCPELTAAIPPHLKEIFSAFAEEKEEEGKSDENNYGKPGF